MIEPTTLDLSGDRLVATYDFHGDPSEVDERVRALCVEQTIEFPADLVARRDLREQIFGQIETIEAAGPIQNQPIGYHHSWLVQLLPYVEEKSLYRHVDKSVGVYHANNSEVRRMRVQPFICPSSGSFGRGTNVGGTNYAGVHHDVEVRPDGKLAALTFEREGILRLAADAVALGHDLGGCTIENPAAHADPGSQRLWQQREAADHGSFAEFLDNYFKDRL